MALLDLLGRRMALRILWELRDDRLTFRQLVERAETNPSVLNTRLRELRHASLIDHDGQGYRLTDHARRLLGLMLPLVEWSEHWVRTLEATSDEAATSGPPLP